MDHADDLDLERKERLIEMGYDPDYPHILPPGMDDRLPSERGDWDYGSDDQ